ncbi:MAG TPA: hypothetical protein VKY90_08120 [Candidatus Dormibacteraeota bacterium]|nr:hypothetical protein [Candidatus Dormibacteraeota bacterium]
MADGILLERHGVPAASILTDAFTASGNAMARTMGADGYRYAVIPHPVSNLTPDECRERARNVLPEVLGILSAGDEASSADVRRQGTGPDHTPAEPAGLTTDRVRELQRVVEYYFERGWTDGLPVVPVTEATVCDFIDYVGRDPDEVILRVEHLGTACTVRLAAVAAAMAGCTREHFPVLLAVLDSFQPSVDTALLQSTSGQAIMVTVNGPIRRALGFNARANVFGPGYRANAVIGRATRLVVINALGIRSGEFDQGTQGTPGKYCLCIAENEEESPWEPLHVERGFPAEASVTTTHFARGTFPVDNRSGTEPEQILLNIADTMSCTTASRGCTVVMGPEHAHLIASRGWSKQEVKRFIWEHWGRRRGDLRRFGLVHDGIAAGGRLGAVEAPDEEFLRFAESPDAILLVVAGARNAGMTTVVPMIRPLFHSQVVQDPRGRQR